MPKAKLLVPSLPVQGGRSVLVRLVDPDPDGEDRDLSVGRIFPVPPELDGVGRDGVGPQLLGGIRGRGQSPLSHLQWHLEINDQRPVF